MHGQCAKVTENDRNNDSMNVCNKYYCSIDDNY